MPAEIDRLLAQAFELHHAEFAEEDDEDPDIVYFVHYVLGWADRTNRLGCLGVPAGVKVLVAFHREGLRRLRNAFPEVFAGLPLTACWQDILEHQEALEAAVKRLARLREHIEAVVSNAQDL